jgi:hypothetical protein
MKNIFSAFSLFENTLLSTLLVLLSLEEKWYSIVLQMSNYQTPNYKMPKKQNVELQNADYKTSKVTKGRITKRRITKRRKLQKVEKQKVESNKILQKAEKSRKLGEQSIGKIC